MDIIADRISLLKQITQKPILKKWWFWVIVLVVVVGLGRLRGSATSYGKTENGVGLVTYNVNWSIAGEQKMTFDDVSKKVFNFLNSSPDAKTLDITMRVECEDNYGKKSIKESHVKVIEAYVTEMRKYTTAKALADGCIEWQGSFVAGYKMCGQID